MLKIIEKLQIHSLERIIFWKGFLILKFIFNVLTQVAVCLNCVLYLSSLLIASYFLLFFLLTRLYRYKKSLREDTTSADLIISHAGSSSIIESLEASKRLIVVVNENLMDNHQLEMAEKMFDLGFLLFATCSELEQKIRLIENGEFALKPYTRGNPKILGNYLNSVLN